jgi:hypothetical protein
MLALARFVFGAVGQDWVWGPGPKPHPFSVLCAGARRFAGAAPKPPAPSGVAQFFRVGVGPTSALESGIHDDSRGPTGPGRD